jgi:hypothetical protein
LHLEPRKKRPKTPRQMAKVKRKVMAIQVIALTRHPLMTPETAARPD